MFLIAMALLAAEPPVPPMRVEVVRDAITDEVKAFATLNEGGNRLVVSCAPERHDGARVSFHSRHWLARGNMLTGERPVTYRFDSLPPQRSMWDVEDRRGRLSGQRRVASFLSHMMSEDRRVDMTFRLADVRPAIEQALAACVVGGDA
jgi:hypothetical protein